MCLHVSCHVQVCVCVCVHVSEREREGSAAGTLNHQLNRYQKTHRTFSVTFDCLSAQREWVRAWRVCDFGSLVELSLMWVGRNIKAGR